MTCSPMTMCFGAETLSDWGNNLREYLEGKETNARCCYITLDVIYYGL